LNEYYDDGIYHINRFFRDIENALRRLSDYRKDTKYAVDDNIPLNEKSVTTRDGKVFVTIDLGCLDEEITAGVKDDILILKINGLTFDLKLPVKSNQVNKVSVNNGIIDIELEGVQDEQEAKAEAESGEN
jgi:hypothetical protein